MYNIVQNLTKDSIHSVFLAQHRNTFFIKSVSQVSQHQLHSTRLVTLAFYLDILSLGFGIDLDFQIVYFILNKLLL